MKTTWKIRGKGQEIELAEYRLGQTSEDAVMTYQQAKARALAQLEEMASPLLQRIEDIKNDVFHESGKLPAFKAWMSDSLLVVAKTKKRAMALTDETRRDFNEQYSEVTGHWWYQFAKGESLWAWPHTKGDQLSEYRELIPVEECHTIIRRAVEEYKAMSDGHLLALVGQRIMNEDIGAAQMRYRTTIAVYKWGADMILIEGELQQESVCPIKVRYASERQLVKENVNWAHLGF